MLYGRTYEDKIRDSEFIIQCDGCGSLRLVTYCQYKYIYPTKPTTKQKCDGLCIKCKNNKPNKTSFEKGLVPWNKGIGTATTEVQQARASNKYKEWRLAVFSRDDYTCQICFKRGGIIHADHIKSFAHHKELRFEINNGRTLCVECHRKTDNYGWKAAKLKHTKKSVAANA